MNALANPEVGKYLNEYFVSSFQKVATFRIAAGGQKQHEFLYWEFHEGGSQQAVRTGDWKAIRSKLGAPLQLYNLRTDLGEQNDVAARNPDVIARIEGYLRTARTESPDWPLKAGKEKKK